MSTLCYIREAVKWLPELSLEDGIVLKICPNPHRYFIRFSKGVQNACKLFFRSLMQIFEDHKLKYVSDKKTLYWTVQPLCSCSA